MGGRAKGVENKLSEEKARLKAVLNECFTVERIKELLSEISASEQIKFYLAALEFTTPKLQRTTVDGTGEDGNGIVINFVKKERGKDDG